MVSLRFKKLALLISLLGPACIPSKGFAMDPLERLLDSQNGANTKAISSYEENGKKYIRKEFREWSVYRSELKNVLELQEAVEQYEASRTSDMPHIAKYHSHDDKEASISYEKAAGESLRIFLIRAALATHSDPYQKEFHLDSVKKAGKSIAKFHLEYGVHGDAHPSNIFFRLFDGGVTLIDYERLSFNKKRDITADVDKLFNHETRTIRGYTTQILEALPDRYKFGFANSKSYEECEEDYRLFQKALMDGYNAGLDQAEFGSQLVNDNGIIKLLPKN